MILLVLHYKCHRKMVGAGTISHSRPGADAGKMMRIRNNAFTAFIYPNNTIKEKKVLTFNV
jgi:hypothetical protein